MNDNEKERSTDKVIDSFEKDKILASRYSNYFNHYIESSKELSKDLSKTQTSHINFSYAP